MILKIKDNIEIRQDNDDLHFIDTTTGVRKIFTTDENFRKMIDLLDEEIEMAKLFESLKEGVNQNLDSEEFKNTIQSMIEHGILDKNNDSDYSLSKNDIERMSRQILFMDSFSKDELDGKYYQHKLKNSTVAIFGLGGTGSWIATFLAQSGVGKLILIDYDVVEKNNLSRQISYNYNDIGKNKTEALKNNLLENFDISIEIFNLNIDENTNLIPLINGVDCVVNCTDQPNVFTTGMWIAKACMPLKIPHIIGGGYSTHLGMIGPTIIPFKSPCWGCYEVQTSEPLYKDYTIIRKRKTSYSGSINVIASQVASLQAFEVIKVLTNISSPSMLGRKGEYDPFKLNFNFEFFRRHPLCPLCGEEKIRENKEKLTGVAK